MIAAMSWDWIQLTRPAGCVDKPRAFWADTFTSSKFHHHPWALGFGAEECDGARFCFCGRQDGASGFWKARDLLLRANQRCSYPVQVSWSPTSSVEISRPARRAVPYTKAGPAQCRRIPRMRGLRSVSDW